MAKKDIFKIDNYMISFGIIFLIIGLLITLLNPRTFNDVMISEDGVSSSMEEMQAELPPGAEISKVSRPIIPPVIALSGLVLLVIGIVFRKKENKIISIWDALEKTGEGRVPELAAALGVSSDFILANLKHINAQQGTYFVYRSDKELIVDGSLLEEHTVSLNCSGCGHNINKKITLANLNGLSCSYCGAPVHTGELTGLRSKIMEENRTAQLEKNEGSFSVPLFIALLLFFWPAAIVYLAVKKGGAAKKSVEAMKQFSQENLQVNVTSGTESSS